jgi:hypothetical protein
MARKRPSRSGGSMAMAEMLQGLSHSLGVVACHQSHSYSDSQSQAPHRWRDLHVDSLLPLLLSW